MKLLNLKNMGNIFKTAPPANADASDISSFASTGEAPLDYEPNLAESMSALYIWTQIFRNEIGFGGVKPDEM